MSANIKKLNVGAFLENFLHKFLSLFFIFPIFFFSNPFQIHFQPKQNISNEDYIVIQKQLRQLHKNQILNTWLSPEDVFWTRNLSLSRCSAGLRQQMICPEKGYYPIQDLVEINQGGDCCIVSFASFDKNYFSMIREIPKALEECGFNGYFYYRIGGFPNPTGSEILYAGVPYSFKMFMIKEAQLLGFDKILWIDSSVLPLNDPTPLFAQIQKEGALFYGWEVNREERPVDIFKAARHFLRETTGVDVYFAPCIRGGLMGLDMSRIQAEQFMEDYYLLVDSGIPFLSEFPEEYVFAALVCQEKNQNWTPRFFPNYLQDPRIDESLEILQELKESGVYFYVRNH